MKSLMERGVTYYIIGNDYEGANKEIFREFIHLETLFINDVVVQYDWTNGNCLIEDSVTLDFMSVRPLPALLLTKLLTDEGVILWMHRAGENDRITSEKGIENA